MNHRRRAAGNRRILSGLLLLVVGVFVAVGAPVIWSVTHRDPALRAIDPGVAVQLADARPGSAIPAISLAGQGSSPEPSPESSAGTSPGAISRPATSPAPIPPVEPTSRRAVSSAPKRESHTVPHATKPAPAQTRALSSAAPVIGAPVRLRIPAIGINAPIAAVGVDDKGDMAVPEQVQQIGWYRFGAAPGSAAGSVVMSGHVDSAQQGLGAFARLGDLRAGDAIMVSDAAGRQLRYRVLGREAFDKKTAPMAALFSRAGSARLTLITCGGDFDSAVGSYLDNIVVTAVPQ